MEIYLLQVNKWTNLHLSFYISILVPTSSDIVRVEAPNYKIIYSRTHSIFCVSLESSTDFQQMKHERTKFFEIFLPSPLPLFFQRPPVAHEAAIASLESFQRSPGDGILRNPPYARYTLRIAD